MSPELQARRILSGTPASPVELLGLAAHLMRVNSFRDARRILALAVQSPEVQNDRALWRRCVTRHVTCIYKDQELPSDQRFSLALDLLGQIDDLAETTDQEILGLAGAIYKRQYELYARQDYLERAAAYYLRGYRAGLKNDYGFTAINAAFVLDSLATRELVQARAAGSRSQASETRYVEADAIRREITETLEAMIQHKTEFASDWSFLLTIAEAHFGLRQYERAAQFVRQAKQLSVDPWIYQNTVRQFSALAGLAVERDQDSRLTDEMGVVWSAFAMSVELASSMQLGKIGLALSGGGFRASLFHIGVLARLAELDLLRHVEIISGESGGSILAAYYYLELRELLQQKRDSVITHHDYIELIRRMEHEFLEGVQRNIRVRAQSSPRAAFRALLHPGYSTAQGFGETLQRELLSRVRGELPIHYMSDLEIRPADEHIHFSPRYDNWRRFNKVPILLINATTLNTGHNWQFTSTWMGEPPASAEPEIDGQDRLRRMYYSEAPAGYRRVRLSDVLAASACTPGLFDPIAFHNLYPGITVRLVDGGVYDNQGIASLLDNDCSVLIVCDGSGIGRTVANPSSGMLNVVSRANEILFSRARKAQYRDLQTRLQASVLRGLILLHLRKDLEGTPRDWAGNREQNESASAKDILTSYGINREVQSLLSELRSDYDSFNDIEAYALMTSGYSMAKYALASSRHLPMDGDVRSVEWRFLTIDSAMRSGRDANLLSVLAVGRWRDLKAFRLSPRLSASAIIILLAFIGAVWTVAVRLPLIEIPISLLLFAVAGLLGALALATLITRRNPLQITMLAAVGLCGWLLMIVRLRWTDRSFLAAGSLRAADRRHPETTPAVWRTFLPGAALANQARDVNRLGRIFELAGCRIQPEWLSGLSPDAGVDIIALDNRHCYCASVKSGVPAGPLVDWTAASALKRGTWQVGQKCEMRSVPVMALVNVRADPSLRRFVDTENVVLVETTSAELDLISSQSAADERAVRQAREYLKLFTVAST